MPRKRPAPRKLPAASKLSSAPELCTDSSRWVERRDMLIQLSLDIGMTRREAEREADRTLHEEM